MRDLAREAQEMRSRGADPETIGRALHAKRRALGVQYKDLTPREILDNVIYPRNIRKYNDPLGPSIEYLRARGYSWEEIIQKASTPGGEDVKEAAQVILKK